MSTRTDAGFCLVPGTGVLTFAEQVRPVLARVRARLMAQWLGAAISEDMCGTLLYDGRPRETDTDPGILCRRCTRLLLEERGTP